MLSVSEDSLIIVVVERPYYCCILMNPCFFFLLYEVEFFFLLSLVSCDHSEVGVSGGKKTPVDCHFCPGVFLVLISRSHSTSFSQVFSLFLNAHLCIIILYYYNNTPRSSIIVFQFTVVLIAVTDCTVQKVYFVLYCT